MRIHFLSPNQKRRCHSFLFPLRAFRRQISDHDIQVRLFQSRTAAGLFDCDMLALVHDAFPFEELLQPTWITNFLEYARAKTDALVWFDISDGTGQIMKFCFDYADLYAKKQLLKNRSLYGQTYFEREYHIDHYYRNRYDELTKLGSPARIVNQYPLDESQTQRMALSWNIGLGDYKTILFGRGQSLRRHWPFASFARPSARPTRRRPIDVSCRIGVSYPAPGVTLHRTSIRDGLAKIATAAGREFRLSGRLNYYRYYQELESTRVGPSPFGMGEICWRDFEILLAGAALLKPDMDHLETWPRFFEADVTYAKHAWDLSDLDQVTTRLLEDDARRLTIAHAGQHRLAEAFTNANGHEFADRLFTLTKRARDIRLENSTLTRCTGGV